MKRIRWHRQSILSRWIRKGGDDVDTAREAAKAAKSDALQLFMERDAGTSGVFKSALSSPPESDSVVESVMGKIREGRSPGVELGRPDRSVWDLAPVWRRALPVAAAFVLGAVAATVGFVSIDLAGSEPAMAAQAENGSETVTVRFELSAPGAESVALVGDFNDWTTDENVLTRDPETGLWTLELQLKEGEIYTYNFLIDESEWVTDPAADDSIPDSFGVPKSVLHL